MSKYNYEKLTPFKWFVLENFPFIEADFDALTNWQLYCKLGKEINKVIDSVNLSGEQLESLTNSFNDLETYVNNYFANLDVQDEINNKLDDMAKDGTLENLISAYLKVNTMIVFENVAEMKASTNLVSGSFAKTLGFYSKNDKGNGEYYITDTLETDANEMNIITLANNLYAVLILNNFNVKTLGAKGDNTQDETEIFKQAISLCENNNYTDLFIPNGDYKITDTLELKTNFYRINIIGENRGFTKINFVNNYEVPIFKMAGGSGIISGTRIDNIHFTGTTDSNTNNQKSIGLHLRGCCGVNIINCKFDNFKYSILIENNATNFSEFVIAKKCDFQNCYNCIRSLRSGSEMSFHGCGIEECTITENSNTDSIIYIDKGCFFYNSKIDFTVWKANTTPLIYLNGDTEYESQTRELLTYGAIKIEGQQTFNIFDGVNTIKVLFSGIILGLGYNYNIGIAELCNFQKVNSTGGIECFLSPVALRIQNIKNGTSLNNYIKTAGSTFKIEGNLTSTNYNQMIEFKFIKVTNVKSYYVVKNIYGGFNGAGISPDNIDIKFNDGIITFVYTRK